VTRYNKYRLSGFRVFALPWLRAGNDLADRVSVICALDFVRIDSAEMDFSSTAKIFQLPKIGNEC
jgi:hypothetical protein